MNEIKCEVIRDLLPLYEDNAASPETRELVREHLADCPACREELRRMRTPISVPPEDDKELWEKFAARRKKQRRKKRNILIGIGAALAAIVLFCLWYTRPQKLTRVLGGQGPINLAAALSDKTPIVEDNGRVSSNIDAWLLNGVEAGDAALDQIWSVLEDASCRASLRSLIPRDYYTSNAPGFINLSFVCEDQSYRSFGLNSDGELSMVSGIGWDIYHVGPAVFDALAEVIQAYGEFQE